MQLSTALLAAVALVGCDGLAITAVPRLPMPLHVAHASRAAVMMQVDEPEPTAEPEPAAEPAVEPAVEPATEPVDMDEAFAAPPLGEEAAVDEGSIAKDALKAEVADGLASGPRPDRAVVGEILLALEAQNPTRSPATSPLLNGKWKFLYASGVSPGLKALQLLLKGTKSAPKSPSGADVVDVQDTYLTITPEQPRATSSVQVRLLSFENTLKLSCRLEAESAVRLAETYDAAQSDYMGLKLPFQSPVEFKRSLLVSCLRRYLDEELLVVRDAAGRPDILMRCDEVEWAASSLGGEPDEDESAPGAS